MRRGIHCSGNFIIDHVKKINKWPKQGMLATISQEVIGTGGGPFNVVVDLAKMDNSLPLFASGVIGKDKEGDIILNILQENHINCSFMQRTSDQPTCLYRCDERRGQWVPNVFPLPWRQCPAGL